MPRKSHKVDHVKKSPKKSPKNSRQYKFYARATDAARAAENVVTEENRFNQLLGLLQQIIIQNNNAQTRLNQVGQEIKNYIRNEIDRLLGKKR